MLSDSSYQEHHRILLEYCKDINEWPARWAIDNSDVQIGKSINEYFKQFLIDRIVKRRAKSTIKIYAKYLWALGGELIRKRQDGSEEGELIAKEFILKYISNAGGPLWLHARDDYEHARYDSVCKQLFKFIKMIGETLGD